MKAALVGADGTLLYEARRPTGRERGPDAVVAAILDFAADLRDHGVRAYGEHAAAAGVAVPGIVDDTEGIAVYASNLGWKDVPLRALLSQRLDGVPVALGHDVRTGGLAEGRIGAGKGADRFLFLPLGTGIAGAIGIDGRIEAGAHGYAGEIGHIVVRPDGPECGCGQRGCLETLASAGAVSRAWAAASGDPERFAFPRPMLGRPDANFSLSGLKTAVRNEASRLMPFEPQDISDLCAGFQAAVLESTADRLSVGLRLFHERFGPPRALVAAGGVAANHAIRAALQDVAAKAQTTLIIPPPALCTDNGAMIAWAGAERMALGLTDTMDAPPRARWLLDANAAAPAGYANTRAGF